MKRILYLIVVAVASALPSPGIAADVNVSVSIGQPGFYGHLDIGNFPHPQLLYAQPIIIQPAPVGVMAPPVYLRVPLGHAKNWRKHCRRYNACSQPVYFVQDNWYNTVYVPRYRQEHYDRDDHDRHDHGRDDDDGKGRGKGHGRGHGKGHKEN